MSDIEDYYINNDGCVISGTIDKYVYITINKKFDDKFKITYKGGELVDAIDDIKHPIIRECLRYVGIKKPIEVVSIADVPAGTGLGSSSAFTVGLLNVLYKYVGKRVNKYKLAEDACHIEIDILDEPIGKQDQYASTFGGLNRYIFTHDEVRVQPIPINAQSYNDLEKNLMLYYTGVTRKSKDILSKQKENMSVISGSITELCDLANIIYDNLHSSNIDRVGQLLDTVWNIKRNTGNITNNTINKIYYTALENGAIGGKLCGAGNGGFLLLYAKPEVQNVLRQKLKVKELPFRLEEYGSTIIYEG